MSNIITHGGPAHADEFIAVALVLASDPNAVISRRMPTPEELADPETWVVDIGGQYDPQLRNFDHHGVPGTEGRCAFDLVVAHLGMTDAAKAASPWMGFKTSIDCLGPDKTAEAFGMTLGAFYASLSPIEAQVLQVFSAAKDIRPGDLLHQLLLMVGQGLLTYWQTFQPQLLVAREAPILEVEGLKFCDFRGPKMIKIMPAVTTAVMEEVGAAGSVSTDNRDPGCERRVILYRHRNHPRVDFRRLNPAAMHFVHDNGFLAKTRTGEDDTEHVMRMLAAAIIPSSPEPVS